MSEKKKSIIEKLFKRKGGCSCGVEIVEEKNDKKTIEKNEEYKSGK